jgi:hypothetical protein
MNAKERLEIPVSERNQSFAANLGSQNQVCASLDGRNLIVYG